MAKSLFSIGYTIDRYGSVVLDKLQLAVLPVATWNDSLPKALMSWREQVYLISLFLFRKFSLYIIENLNEVDL